MEDKAIYNGRHLLVSVGSLLTELDIQIRHISLVSSLSAFLFEDSLCLHQSTFFFNKRLTLDTLKIWTLLRYSSVCRLDSLILSMALSCFSWLSHDSTRFVSMLQPKHHSCILNDYRKSSIRISYQFRVLYNHFLWL